MAGNSNTTRAGVWPGFAAIGLATCYLAALLAAEQQDIIIALLALGIVAVLAAAWFGLLGGVSRSFTERDDAMGVFGVVALVALGAYFHEDHFILLLVVTVIALQRGDARAEHPVRLCRRVEFRRRLVLRHRRLYLGGAQYLYGGAASHRAADRRPAGGADRLAAAAAGAAHARALRRGGDHCVCARCSRPSSRSTTCSAARRACRCRP